MRKKSKRQLMIGAGLLILFALWTILVHRVDVRPIGPQGSSVGFAALNGAVHNFTGVNMLLYTITDWLGLVPIGIALGFGILGLSQWIRRRRLLQVDRSILALGGFYIVVMAVFVCFEVFVINYRPVLIEGRLEASYPSSTTMLAICVLSTAVLQFRSRIEKPVLRRWVISLSLALLAFLVIGRVISGVHWFSDILGGAVLSAGLVSTYYALSGLE